MSSARQIAFDLLNKVYAGHKPLDHWLDNAESTFRKMDPKEKSLAHAIVLGTLRWQRYLDHIIDTLADKPKKIDPHVRTILRIALFQMTQLDRIPTSAAVNTAVELAKKNHKKWASGFVNGLLRKAATRSPQIIWPDWQKEPNLAIGIRLAFPQWLVTRWADRWGVDETRQLCEIINTIAPITVRTNTLKTTRERLVDTLTSQVQQIAPTQHTPDGIVITNIKQPIHQWQAFADGWFQIQDEAAQLVSLCLDPNPGETVWDACAGLGTKTGHMAQLMANKGTIVASDISPAKIERQNKEMHRLGVTIVKGMALDLAKIHQDTQLPKFDRILVDAPCSGLGVLQKNPDGKWHTRFEDLKRHHLRQIDLLERVAPYLQTQGMLVFSVCSREPEENEMVIKAFLQKHPEFAIHIPKLSAVSQSDKLLTPQGWLATLPHKNGMDGFFAAALIKTN